MQSDSSIGSIPHINSDTSIMSSASGTPTNTSSSWLDGTSLRNSRSNDTEISELGMTIKKTDRAALGSKELLKLVETSTAGMASKFTQLTTIDEKATLEIFSTVYSIVTRFGGVSPFSS
mmetsp:Transcript_8908/g.10311  ORF Transcript_8908/g.10311 Transcript_8908/m.10311 type:complete len:119 (+) Transcript_8908:199-555(+)